MPRPLKIIALSFFFIVLFFVLQSISRFSFDKHKAEINGVSFVSPPQPVHSESFQPIVDVNANWVAIIPYAFSRSGEPEVHYNHNRQWWGEKPEGVIELIKSAHSYDLKVMLKPHVWVLGDGWPGEFTLETEDQWKIWEAAYQKYILHYAKIADSLDVGLYCIGTEYRKTVQQRPDFWQSLINEVRRNYQGPLTYAANWDNFKNVSFWNQLDFIGINAYFPLSKDKTPNVDRLLFHWKSYENELHRFHSTYNKPIIFTEFGYRSIDFAASGHWNLTSDTLLPNPQAQSNALDALFLQFWSKSWIQGGFIWKWYPDHKDRGGIYDPHFTPQNKPAELVIRKWFGNQSQ